jgi:hypothetical protein
MRVVFRNPNESSPSCPNEESVGIWVCHFNSAWYPLNCWVPNTGEGTRLRNGQSLVIDTGDPISTVDGDPNGFFVNPGDFIATSAGSWNNAECDKTFDNESTNPLQVWIWQKTPETPTYQ